MRHNLTFDPIVAFILGMGTQILCVTHFLIMLSLSVKFHQISFGSFLAWAWLAKPKANVVIPRNQPLPKNLGKK